MDAHALLLTCCVAIYMGFPFGMSTAATIRVGNLVGANRPTEARLSGLHFAFRGLCFAFRCLHLPFGACTCRSGSALAFWGLHLPVGVPNFLFGLCTCPLNSALAFPVVHLPFMHSTCLEVLHLPFRVCTRLSLAFHLPVRAQASCLFRHCISALHTGFT